MSYETESETAEYMNPNSFYTDAYKYQFLDLSKPNNVSEETLNNYPVSYTHLDVYKRQVPMRFLFEQMGADVEWNGETQTATATLDNTAAVSYTHLDVYKRQYI